MWAATSAVVQRGGCAAGADGGTHAPAARAEDAPLRFGSRPDVPGLSLDADHLMAPLRHITPADWEKYDDFRDRLNGRPELQHRLLGFPFAPNGGNACSARGERARLTWRQVAMFDYDERLGFTVGDGGDLQLLISPADLRAGRFGRVCGVFEDF